MSYIQGWSEVKLSDYVMRSEDWVRPDLSGIMSMTGRGPQQGALMQPLMLLLRSEEAYPCSYFLKRNDDLHEERNSSN